MKALVTGGAGFIGSCLAKRLVRDGHTVSVVDDLSRGTLLNLVEVKSEIKFIQSDICSRSFASVVAKASPDVIFHLAGHVDVSSSITNPLCDARTNILGTVNVAEAARNNSVRKIVFSSSGGSIYGQREILPISEEAPLDPLSPYAVAKVSSELYLNVYSRLHGVQCTHLALANVYGPSQNPNGEAGVVAIFTRAILSGKPALVLGDGNNTRDYIYVDDVASAFLLAAGKVGDRRRYNIGTGIQTSDRALHDLVAATVGSRAEPTFGPARVGDVRTSALDATRAQLELGWRPIYDVAYGIRATITSVPK